MPRILLNPELVSFDDLRGQHQSDAEHETARRVLEKWFPGAPLLFDLWSVPLFDLVESSVVAAVLRGEIPAPAYEAWRTSGADQTSALRDFAATLDRENSHPARAGDKQQIETLTALYASNAEMDPLIARGLEMPLSLGAEALFMLDGHHRLAGAVKAGAGALNVYIGHPTGDQSSSA